MIFHINGFISICLMLKSIGIPISTMWREIGLEELSPWKAHSIILQTKEFSVLHFVPIHKVKFYLFYITLLVFLCIFFLPKIWQFIESNLHTLLAHHNSINYRARIIVHFHNLIKSLNLVQRIKKKLYKTMHNCLVNPEE